MFSALQPAVEHVLRAYDIEDSVQFRQFVRDELSKDHPNVQLSSPDKRYLRKLYELRAKYLDWELGTGYLGCFSTHAGTRYAFTRIKEIVYRMCPRLTPQAQVLEIGCGAGLFCFVLAQTAKTVVGTDISYFVLDFANKVKEYMKHENVSFQYGDAETLMFRDKAFDLVICSEVLEHLTSPEKALAEMRRVVKDSGTIIMTTPCAVSFSDMTMNMIRKFNKHIEAEKTVHFDKKTYLAAQRKGEHFANEIFFRVHERFQYRALMDMFQNARLCVEQSLGIVFAFPPHSQVFYRYCPAFLLPIIQGLEDMLNKIHVFQRFGSVTTCFLLKPVSNTQSE